MKAALTALGVAIVLGATAAAASAHGGPPETSTTTFQGGTETVAGFDCDGNEGVEDHVFNGVLHVTEFADGHSQVTLTQAGTWTLDLPAPLPDYTGRYVIHESHTTTGNVDGLTIAVPFIGRGTDGSHFRLVFTLRLTIVDGTVVVERIGFQCVQ